MKDIADLSVNNNFSTNGWSTLYTGKMIITVVPNGDCQLASVPKN